MTSGWRLAGQGAWAIADQALFALASFLLNLLLARQLGPAEYGVFGVAFTVFLLVSMAYTTLVLEPLLVFGAGRWRSPFRAYLRQALVLSAAVAACGGVVLWAGSILVTVRSDTAPLAPLLRTLIWAAPCIVLQWTMRRATYVHGRPDIAATGGTIYLVALLGVANLVQMYGALDARMAFVIMAAVSVVVAAFLAWRLVSVLPRDGADPSADPPARPTVWRAHWGFGRWALAGAVVGWLATDIFYLVLAPQHGFAAVGKVRAAFNLVLPVIHVLTALSTVALPHFAAAHRRGGMHRSIVLFWGGLNGLAAAYALVLWLASDVLVVFLYGETFRVILPLVTVFGLLPLAAATSAAFATVLRAMERPRDVFVASAIAAVVGAAIGVPATVVFAGMGAVSAIVLNAAVYSAALAWRLRRTGARATA